jgi:MFS family permease
MFYVFLFVFECTLGGIQYIYIGKIFPTHIRFKGMAIGTSGLALMNVIWLQVAPIAFKHIGWKFYHCFICPPAVAAVFIYIYFPDTKGLPLESVAALFEDEVGDDLIDPHV